MTRLTSLAFSLYLLSFGSAMAQPRFLSLFPQADVDTRIHPSHVRSLNDGRILTATLLASEQGVELLHWDACGYNLQRRRLTLSPVRRVVGFEASENASTTLALQTDSLTLALIRIQPDGSIAWARHYRTSSPITWTSFDGDEKHFVVGGYAPGLARVLAIKLDSGGGLLWSRAAAQAGNAGQVCLTPQGRVFQIVSDRKALLWSESGNVLWMAHVGGLHFGMINLKPTVLSDGYAVAVRRLFNYLHVVKLTEDGQLAWFTQALPVDIFTTSTQLFNTGIKRLLPFGKDSVLVLANFGLSAADGGYVSIHLVGPNGQLLRRNFIQPGGGFRAQDVAASGRHVAVSGLGSANSGNGLMQLTKALTLGCGDFQQPALTDPTITVEVTLDSLPPVSNWPLMVSNLATQIQTLSPYSPTFYCQTNDTAATDLVHRRPTCLGEVVYLRPEAPEGAVITWADGRRDTVFRAEGPGTYSAQIAYCGLNWRVEYSLEARDCACEPIYPTAFTPDGDGVNDAFGPIAVPECAYAAFEWAVFNRWGERLFASSSPADAWNGRRPDGQAAPSDVYVWQLRYALPNGSERAWFVKKGDVTLMR